MKIVKSLLFKFAAVLVFFSALLAASYNSQEVSLTFGSSSTPALPLSVWVLGSFVLGAVFSALINTWSNTRLRLDNRRANKLVQKTNKTIDQVRAEKGPENSEQD